MQSFHCFQRRPLLLWPINNEPRKSSGLPISLSHTVITRDCLSSSLGRVSKLNSSLKIGCNVRHLMLVLCFLLRWESGFSCLKFNLIDKIMKWTSNCEGNNIGGDFHNMLGSAHTYTLTNGSEEPFLSFAIKFEHRLTWTMSERFLVL